jgi:hypothetical protein
MPSQKSKPTPRAKSRLEAILDAREQVEEQQSTKPLIERNPTMEELNRAFERRGRKLFGSGGLMGK